MLTLIIKTDLVSKNAEDKVFGLLQSAKTYEKDVQTILLAHENCPYLDELKQITVNNNFFQLFVCDNRTSDEEMIQMGFVFAENSDTMLTTINTMPDVVLKILEKRKNEYAMIRVKKQTNICHSFFRVLGVSSYKVGLKILGNPTENCAEAEVGYYDGRIVSSLCEDMKYSRKNRISNIFKHAKTMTVEQKQIFENEEKKHTKEQKMFTLGIFTLLFWLGFIGISIVYPSFHNLVYTWWMILIMLAWVGLGIFGAMFYSKNFNFKRCGLPNRVNNYDEPLFGYSYYYKTGDELKEKKEYPKIDKIIIKNKIKIKKRK